jgi:restriction system protein
MLIRLTATTRPTPARLREDHITRRRLTHLTWFLAGLTILFVLWVLWRYGVAAGAFLRAPAWLTDTLGLLTGAGFLTLLALWGLVGWQRRGLPAAPRRAAMSVADLYALSPRAFEHYVAELFERRGYTVEVRGRAGDLGVDLALTRADGRRAIVQCKRYRHTIGPEIVRELFGTMLHERAAHGFLVTTAEISDAARAWAADKPITLIDGQTLSGLTD